MKISKFKQLLAAFALAVGVVMPTSSEAAVVDISWTGAGGYSMTGQFSFSDSLLNTGVITSSSLTSFYITGYLNGGQVGSWNYFADGLTGTTFNFNFNTTTLAFPQSGSLVGTTNQAWNNIGTTSGCNTFAFISGGTGQGLCVNGVFIAASKVPLAGLALHATLEAPPAVAVPEPDSLLLVGIGLLLVSAGLRRKFQ